MAGTYDGATRQKHKPKNNYGEQNQITSQVRFRHQPNKWRGENCASYLAFSSLMSLTSWSKPSKWLGMSLGSAVTPLNTNASNFSINLSFASPFLDLRKSA